MPATAAEAKAYACGDLTPTEVAAGQTTPTCGVVNATAPIPPATAAASPEGPPLAAALVRVLVCAGAGGVRVVGRRRRRRIGGAGGVDPGVSLGGSTGLAFTGMDIVPWSLLGTALLLAGWFVRRRLGRTLRTSIGGAKTVTTRRAFVARPVTFMVLTLVACMVMLRAPPATGAGADSG